MQIVTDIPGICFPCELQEIEIGGLALSSATEVSLAFDDPAAPFFQTTLWADGEGSVKLEDLAWLIAEAAEEYMLSAGATPGQTYELYLSAGGEERMICDLVPCRCDPGLPAQQFVRQNFLSLQDGVKDIPADAGVQPVVWTFASAGEVPRVVATVYSRGQGRLTEVEHVIDYAPLKVGELDFSPESLLETLLRRENSCPADAELLEYTVCLGLRRLHFRVRHDAERSAMGVCFRNSFGFNEVFYFSGAVERELKVARETASFAGKKRVYYLEAHTEIKAHTGHLSDGAFPVLCDLARSAAITRADNGEDLIILEHDIKDIDEGNFFLEASVTFQSAGKWERGTKKARVRTFDQTFDETYE